jgi:Tfp pilus assembly protein PilF
MSRIPVLLLLLIFIFAQAFAGCAPQQAEMTSFPYHEQALYNYSLARRYQAQGRFELAREKLALALAISRNSEFQAQCMDELERTENMIHARR